VQDHDFRSVSMPEATSSMPPPPPFPPPPPPPPPLSGEETYRDKQRVALVPRQIRWEEVFVPVCACYLSTLTRLCSACYFVTNTLREAQKYPFHYLAMAGDVDALVMC
jgi:hypothetical protein